MNTKAHVLLLLLFTAGNALGQKAAEQFSYLDEIKSQLSKEWPSNRTVNLVFHGHSVPAGYFKTPIVNTLESYPYLLHQSLKWKFPYAVINQINTAIGGENSRNGAKRFKKEVLNYKPDVLFIDYSLNDRSIGLAIAKKSWEKMIQLALRKNIRVILLSPTPDMKVDLKKSNTILDDHAAQVKELAKKYGIGFVDSYDLFKTKVLAGEDIANFMSQGNHPNKNGHILIVDELLSWF